MNFINSLLPTIQHYASWGYWLVFLFSFFESVAFIGLIVPGAVVLVIAGFLASQHIINIIDLFWIATLGAILGDTVSFFLGRKGVKIFRQEAKIFKLHYLEKGERFFKKYGAKSVFWGRFIGWVRPVIPFVAGLFKMKQGPFFFWNTISGLLWAAGNLALGYFFGQAWLIAKAWSTRMEMFFLIIISSLIFIWFLKWLTFRYGKKAFAFCKSCLHSIGQGIAQNEDVQRLVAKYPRFFHFLKARFERKKFTGLPLTLLLTLFLWAFFLLIGTIEDFITSSSIVATDVRIENLLAAFRGPVLNKVFLWLTFFGQWQLIIIFSIIIAAILWLIKKRVYIWPFAITLFGNETFVFLAKKMFHRPRPEVGLYVEHSFSFPSGHAAIAVAFYGFLAYILISLTKKWSKKINIAFASAVIILLIGFSRLYLGMHFLSDVWSGYLLGFLWIIAGISLTEWLISKQKSQPSFVWTTTKKLFVSGLIGLVILSYIGFAWAYHPQLKKPPLPNKEITVGQVTTIFSIYKLPKYTEGLTAKKQEPLNFIILAKNDQQLISAFQKAGWYLADKPTLSSILKLIQSAASNKEYLKAPMTPSFWNTQVNQFGFEKPTKEYSVKQRHHARFWKTQFKVDGKQVYVGTASLDIGLKWDIVHKIDPDIDTEREVLFNDLSKAGVIGNFKKMQFVKPEMGENFLDEPFFTDGKAYLLTLR